MRDVMIRILIVDDHKIFREGIKQLLTGNSELIHVEDTSNGKDALEKIRSIDYDVVILDIALADENGLEILNEIKRIKPKISVLILSMYPEETYAIPALKGGAAGYLSKGHGLDELEFALKKILDGKKYVSIDLAEKMAQDLEIGGEDLPHQKLAKREYQVMLMLISGKTVKEISYKLSLNVKTIHTYRYRILSTIDVKNDVELLIYAIKHGLYIRANDIKHKLI